MLESAPERELNDAEKEFIARANAALDKFDDAMCDDLNTSEAMGVIFDYVREMNTMYTDANAASKAVLEEGLKILATMTDVLGLLSKEYDATPEDIKALVEARTAAKKAKDFAEADRIRAEVLEKGYIIEDTPKGPKVRKA
jgi:cysteinyl-tRNA synthetase